MFGGKFPEMLENGPEDEVDLHTVKPSSLLELSVHLTVSLRQVELSTDTLEGGLGAMGLTTKVLGKVTDPPGPTQFRM